MPLSTILIFLPGSRLLISCHSGVLGLRGTPRALAKLGGNRGNISIFQVLFVIHISLERSMISRAQSVVLSGTPKILIYDRTSLVWFARTCF